MFEEEIFAEGLWTRDFLNAGPGHTYPEDAWSGNYYIEIHDTLGCLRQPYSKEGRILVLVPVPRSSALSFPSQRPLLLQDHPGHFFWKVP